MSFDQHIILYKIEFHLDWKFDCEKQNNKPFMKFHGFMTPRLQTQDTISTHRVEKGICD
jgi:hypothetical protein